MSNVDRGVPEYAGSRHRDDWVTRKIVAEGTVANGAESHCLIALGQITAGAIHDLKNFCGQAKGLQKLAERELSAKDYSKATRHVGMLGFSIESIIALCENILQFGSSKCRDLGNIELSAVVGEVVTMASVVLDGVDITICDRCRGVYVKISRFQLQQILLNLIRNAQQAFQCTDRDKKGAKISIVVHPMRRASDVVILENMRHDRYVGVSVDDNGIGMSEEVLSKVACPFFTTKSIGQGTGLGLFMSAHLAELYEGALIIRTKQGVGTRVTLCLPLSSECP